MLSLIAHLEKSDGGSIDVPDDLAQSTGYMMQDPLLLPWRTLRENALLGAEIKGMNNCDQLCSQYFGAFALSGNENLYPAQSSGGMRQRTALIRTLLTKPSLLLMDEPFSSLDFDTKLRVQHHLLSYQTTTGCTIIMVTHDIEDAIALSDRIIIFGGTPTRVRKEIGVDLGAIHDPVEARKSGQFAEYFRTIWDELKLFEETAESG